VPPPGRLLGAANGGVPSTVLHHAEKVSFLPFLASIVEHDTYDTEAKCEQINHAGKVFSHELLSALLAYRHCGIMSVRPTGCLLAPLQLQRDRSSDPPGLYRCSNLKAVGPNVSEVFCVSDIKDP
jgi:hypothetical protein